LFQHLYQPANQNFEESDSKSKQKAILDVYIPPGKPPVHTREILTTQTEILILWVRV